MQQGFNDVKGDIKRIDGSIKGIDSRIEIIDSRIKKIDFKLEDLDKKVELSLEGHKNNTEQLNRIESEVAKHEEIILRRVK